MNTKHTTYRPPPKTNTDNAINHPQINKSIKQIKTQTRRQNRMENENTNRPVSPPNFRTARWWW